MNSRLTKEQLRAALDFDTDAQLADFFGISAAAVSQWGEDDPVPELRQLQFERKRPDLAGTHPARHASAAQTGVAADAAGSVPAVRPA